MPTWKCLHSALAVSQAASRTLCCLLRRCRSLLQPWFSPQSWCRGICKSINVILEPSPMRPTLAYVDQLPSTWNTTKNMVLVSWELVAQNLMHLSTIKPSNSLVVHSCSRTPWIDQWAGSYVPENTPMPTSANYQSATMKVDCWIKLNILLRTCCCETAPIIPIQSILIHVYCILYTDHPTDDRFHHWCRSSEAATRSWSWLCRWCFGTSDVPRELKGICVWKDHRPSTWVLNCMSSSSILNTIYGNTQIAA